MSDIKVRIGQQNAVKIVSSISGSSSGRSIIAENVIGGIGSIRELNVSGISTFVGLSTFNNGINVSGISTFVGLTTFSNNVYVGQSLYIAGNLVLQSVVSGGSITVPNVIISGIATISSLSYGSYQQNGIAYFNNIGRLNSTTGPSSAINFTNYILTTNDNNVPVWSNTIDGGVY